MSLTDKKGCTGPNKPDFDYIKVPKKELDLLLETLSLDSQSSMYNEELKTDISNALESIVFLSENDIEVLHKLDIEREENEHFENNLDQVRPIPIIDRYYKDENRVDECVSCGTDKEVHECWNCDIILCIDCDKDGMRTDSDDHTYCWQCGPSEGV